MSINIQKAGIFTTVQDLGRTGFRHLGINPGGAMDPAAVRLINILLGNQESEAVLEMHFPAPVIEFGADAAFALGGADFAARLDGKPVQNWRPLLAKKGSALKFTGKTSGTRAYIAVAGGFRLEKWLGSLATNGVVGIGGYHGRKLENGDRIYLHFHDAPVIPANSRVSTALIPHYSRFPTVRITAGAEFDRLTALAQETLLRENFVITPESDRMGFRLRGKPLHLLEPLELISSAVNFGTIQLLPDGQVIVLMADHQTTGGYPRLGHIASVDLPLIGQLGPGDKVGFHLIPVEDAAALAVRFESDLNLFKTACRFLVK